MLAHLARTTCGTGVASRMRPRTQHGRRGTIPHAPLGTTPVAHAPAYKTRQMPCNPHTSGATRKGIQQSATSQCEDPVAWRAVRRRMRRLVWVSRMTCENLVTQHRDCSGIQPPAPDSCLRCENPITRQEDYLPDSTTQTTQSLRVRQSAHTLPTRTAPNRRFGVTEGGCARIHSHDDCLGGTWRPMLVGAGGAMRASTHTRRYRLPSPSASPQAPRHNHYHPTTDSVATS